MIAVRYRICLMGGVWAYTPVPSTTRTVITNVRRKSLVLFPLSFYKTRVPTHPPLFRRLLWPRLGLCRFLVRVSYLEIYNEEVRDLLGKVQTQRLEVKERPDVGVYVKDLSAFVVNNADDMDKIMTLGNKNRQYKAYTHTLCELLLCKAEAFQLSLNENFQVDFFLFPIDFPFLN